MNDKNNWEEISNDVNEVAKKIKKKIGKILEMEAQLYMRTIT